MAKASKCKTCSGATKGWKCDMCGAVASVYVESHGCGGEHCVPVCADCRQAETLCSC